MRATTESERRPNRLRRFVAGAARAGLRLRLAARVAPCRNPAGFVLLPDTEARFTGRGMTRKNGSSILLSLQRVLKKCFCALPCRPKAASASVRDGKPKAHRGEAALAEATASRSCAVSTRWIASAIAVSHGFGGRAPAPKIMTHLHSTITRSAIWAGTCARSRHGRSLAPKDCSRRRKPAPRRSGSCHATCAASPSWRRP